MSHFPQRWFALAGIGVILCSSSISTATTEQKPTTPGSTKVVVEGTNASLNEVDEEPL